MRKYRHMQREGGKVATKVPYLGHRLFSCTHSRRRSLLLYFSYSMHQSATRPKEKKKNRLIVSWGSSPKHGAHSFSRRGPDCIQSLSVLTMRRYVARNQSCFDSGCVGVSFPRSRLSCSADDGRRSFVACPCTSPSPPPRWSLLQCVQVCVCVCV